MESILEKYLGDIKSSVPFNRILLFTVAFLVSVISHDKLSMGLFRTLLSVRISELRFSDGSLLGSAVVGDGFLAGLIVLVSWALYLLVIKLFISWLWARLKLDSRVAAIYDSYGDITLIPQDIRTAALELANAEAARRLSITKKLAGLAELFLGACVLFLLMSFYSGTEDAIVAVIFMASSAIAQFGAIVSYLRWVLPQELHVSALSGARTRLGMPTP